MTPQTRKVLLWASLIGVPGVAALFGIGWLRGWLETHYGDDVSLYVTLSLLLVLITVVTIGNRRLLPRDGSD